MKTVFFTLVSDDYYYQAGTPILINSFKRFHPDIDLVVFRQETIDKVFKEKKINFYMAKPTFAKLLSDKYDLVVNIDCDHIVLARLDEILKGDYDMGGPVNLNDFENRSVENINEVKYLQGGLIASTNKKFWDIWEEKNKNALNYLCKENDVMNLVIYNDPVVSKMKLKVFDKDKDYYGCKSLGREKEFYLEEDKVMCRKEQVFLYHNAKGYRLPKLQFEMMGFPRPVIDRMNNLGNYGRSIKIGEL
jgi:hypothetical protein